MAKPQAEPQDSAPGNHQVGGNDGGRRRAARPLDAARMEELALGYVARFSTSAAKLRRYLERKLRERGWEGEGEPDTQALALRYVELGYVDDEAFARSRSGSLLRRGYGARRIAQVLGEAGIDGEVREAMRPDEPDLRRAALAMARKRRFGPFGKEPVGDAPDRAVRERQIAAMLRAGHTLDSARRMVDAPSVSAAEQWVAEAEEEYRDMENRDMENRDVES